MPSYCFYKDLVWNNMGAKWHTPIFVLGLGNNLFDLLFARMRVLLHLDLSRFLRLCNKSGLKTEPSTRAETNLFLSKFREMPLLNGRTIKAAGPNGKNAVISQELLNKIFYDLISPQMVINRLREIVEVC